MSHPSHHARTHPDKIAYRMARSGETISYRELDARSNQAAHVFRSLGLGPGDHIALVMENRLEFLVICWAAQRSGLYFTPISCYLTRDEVAYIVGDCGARVVIASRRYGDALDGIDRGAPGAPALFMVDEPRPGFRSWSEALAAQPDTPIGDRIAGQDMLYSSGTTGRPKGIKRALDNLPFDQAHPRLRVLCVDMCGMSPDTVYLSPAPLYHAAPLRFTFMSGFLGATTVIMEAFDAEEFLQLVARHRVTVTQLVPTMFVRMLKLPEEVRRRHDLSSLRGAIHAAAPCPVDVKQQMIDWWGPILIEYYAGSEGNGATFCTSAQWLAHRGSVGRATGCDIHVVDESGRDLPTGEIGMIYFAGGRPFEYHNDPVKTAAAHNEQGWGTLGDYGWLDADGYLYIADRRADLIISGGVNIYPREIEDVIINHPHVLDVAVIGAADEEMGQRVVAYVQPRQPSTSSTLASEVDAWCRAHLAGFKCPRAIEVVEALPRTPDGKLRRRLLGAGPTT